MKNILIFRENGQFDWTTMGHTSNVGLMAQKAEEYGSHDKTFTMTGPGVVRVLGSGGEIFSHPVEEGDIWRMCQTKDAPVRDWVRLAVSRARATGAKTIFWLDPARAHDNNIISLSKKYLESEDTAGLDLAFMTPVEAMRETCRRARLGQDTVSVTGNVLRDYLTDLFPILELGTSAKMLSIVPLLAGGRLLETGAGGSAPKHVEQLLKENHLRWDSLGEYLATAIGFQEIGARTKDGELVVSAEEKCFYTEFLILEKVTLLGDTLMEAVGVWLESNKAPGRKVRCTILKRSFNILNIQVRELDNRGSNYYLALYWAQALATRDAAWGSLAKQLEEAEAEITKELVECQGQSVDIGGYYHPDPAKAEAVMRPSKVFNRLIDAVGSSL